MKKGVVLLLLLLLAAGAAFYFLRQDAGVAAPKLAPAATVLFVDLPDIQRTQERWEATALHKLGQEPEVAAFLERPASKVPGLDATRDKARKIADLKPREAFFALASIQEEIPRFVAGLKFKGKKEDLDPLLDDARNRIHAAWPAGKADLAKYGSVEIETFTNGDLVFAAAFDKEWYLVADDLALLKTTIDRVEGKGDAPGGTLEDEPRYKASLKHLPAESDGILYVQPETVTQRLLSLATAAGAQVQAAEVDQIKAIHGAAAAVKLDGENLRDALFVLAPSGKGETPMARSALLLTSTNTLFYGAAVLGHIRLPAGAAAAAAPWMPPGFALPRLGFGAADFEAAFGPELSSLMDWPSGYPQPSLLFSLDVRDAGKAKALLDTLFAGPLGAAWAHRQLDGTHYYVMSSSQIPTITPSLALTDKFLFLGPNFDEVKAAVQNAANPASSGASLPKTAAFQAAAGLVSKPSRSFVYIDGQALCERVYGTLRPFAILWANFQPKLLEYVDPNKLPSTETLMRHLGPIVYSTSATEDGRLVESAGTVTFTELLGSVAIGGGIAVLPTLKARLQDMRAILPPPAAPAPSPKVP